jgi:hypothetical protein
MPSAAKKRKTSSTAPPKPSLKKAAASSDADASSSDSEANPGGVALEAEEEDPRIDNDDDNADASDRYDSGSSSENDDDDDLLLASDSSADDDDDDDIDDLLSSSAHPKKKRKRNDPAAFSTSMSKILGSHLTTTARKDPVLVRAKSAPTAEEDRLEAKAKRVLKEEKRAQLEKGRVKVVVPTDDDREAKRVIERERMHKNTARSGVVKWFNALRAAQQSAEGARGGDKRRVATKSGEEKVAEMSKQGFLDLIQAGGKSK